MMGSEAVDSTDKITSDLTKENAALLRRDYPLFKALFQQAAIGIAVVDNAGHMVEYNPKLGAMLGFGEQELINKKFAEIIHPDDLPLDAALHKELLEQKDGSYQTAIRCIRKGGGFIWGLLAVSVIRDAKGDVLFTIRMIEDITDRKRAEESIVKSRNFFLSLLDELPNPIRRTDVDGKCDYFNKAWLAFTGRTLGQEIGDAWARSVHAEDRDRLITLQFNSLSTRSPYVTEYRLRFYNGDYHWVVEFGSPFHEIDGSFGGYVSSCYDVQDRKTFEERLELISTTDELTGLLNRRGFFTLAQQQIKLANRNKSKLLLFYLDLDGLKKINDTLGHSEGDLALAEVAAVLREIFRASDIIGRLGGDEFAVLLFEPMSFADEQAIFVRLRETLQERNARPGRRYTLSLSTGIKAYDPASPCSLDELISGADTIMYKEKKLKYRSRQSRP
jgi:diguanylate cyclase (GGDEF)-like protein/PAS domain S-box-containing protein